MTIYSLCTGIGGLDLAATRALHTRLCCTAETDPTCTRTINRNHPGVTNHGDITKQPNPEHRHDIITAGYPCQPFSQAGKRRGGSDPRHLWPHIHQIILKQQPKLVILENVPGHITLGLDTVLTQLAEAGYETRYGTFTANQVGAPHLRKRLFITALANPAGTLGEGIRLRPSEPSPGGYGFPPQTFLPPAWGDYEPAIRRWESIIGPHPYPTTRRARDGKPQVSPYFVEWMMGFPHNWITGHGESHNNTLKALGNAVVPQQGEHAIRTLLERNYL